MTAKPVFIVILGGPGSGKGTQAKLIEGMFKIPHISTRILLQNNMQKGTTLGLEAKIYINAGELVPDSVIANMLRERLKQADCKAGAIFDGFPKTESQFITLIGLLAELGAKPNLVLHLKVKVSVMIERLTSRVTCTGTGQHVYNLKIKAPKTAGKCDIDGTGLVPRADDGEMLFILTRISAYFQATAPLVSHFRKLNAVARIVEVKEIDGEKPIEAVWELMTAAVEPFFAVSESAEPKAQAKIAATPPFTVEPTPA
ncbi:hypothetical protein A2716_00620 [candidate division WWE3 bacterium RIFCSPHIGHO2_01_FULL_40_23]|uniref:Adenylate kinase n=1 Tax=candidate division WWE3 bacterium RIFCSPLOWO2_01_FULL_41_18 TaxID=1802625 RepID=A0A1F4VE80_UNCKA|nr:MAG: hypothetical protein A2716_00620 [candidate division WWE3 bacterium RIFCSPHIGHO2_01_FULL_40_23]OGC55497.1 MAG: hypothetical protein A3A78_00890 [candidate division WWE3 bacterium RIFCSPLOWO2_01_FULL_41_18]